MDELKKKITDFVMDNNFKYDLKDFDDINNALYNISSELWLDVEFTSCENSSDAWIEATVYVKNLLWEHKWYNVVIDVSFKNFFENKEEFIDSVYYADQHAKNVLSYFNK